MKFIKFGCTSCLVLTLAFFAFLTLGVWAAKYLQDTKGESIVSLNVAMPVQDLPFSANSVFGSENKYGKLNEMEIANAIARASCDNSVSAILLYCDNATQMSLAQACEIRNALLNFRESGKKVYAAADYADKKAYYIFSAADEIFMDEMGEIDLSGLAFEGVFFGNAFKKYGVSANVVKCGKYKDFGDMFTKSGFSPEAKAQLTNIAQNLWQNLLNAVARARAIDAKALESATLNTPIFGAKEAVSLRLADKIADKAKIKKTLFKDGTINEIPIEKYAKTDGAIGTLAPDKTALVYMSGDIVMEDSSSDILEGKSTISAKFYSAIFDEIAGDDTISSVVIRINSGGGSAQASEQIRRSLQNLAQKKPVFVSVSSMCASGAYWIASAAHKIFAQEQSLIGSIGVFSINFGIENLADSYGVNFDTAKSGKFADMLSPFRQSTPEENAIIQSRIDFVYDKFISLVADSRKIDKAAAKNLATGEVWTAQKAKDLKLIDASNMTLSDTMALVLQAQDEPSQIEVFPKKPSWKEFLDAFFGEATSTFLKALRPESLEQKKTDFLRQIKGLSPSEGILLYTPYKLENLK
ncbi:MAG: signal peptide peptidase SppA [Opitutales bacterium]|nr:signal peptide peptidase SppA [Opitutales bacterium]